MPNLRPNPGRAFLEQGDDHLQALLAVPADRRSFFLRNSRRADALVEALVRHCFSLRFHDLGGMLATGRLAASAADALTVRQTGRSERELCDLRAHAWAVLGNALRIAGNVDDAEQALATAGRRLLAGTDRRPDLAALLLELSASLREGQREFAEARRLLAGALAIRRALGDRNGIGKVRIQQGIVQGYAGEPELAVAALVEAIELVADDQGLACAAYQSLAWHLVEMGKAEKARRLLAEVRVLLVKGGDLVQLKVRWLEAKLAAEGGPWARAEARERYEATGRAYARRGLLHEARLVALDLRLFDGLRGA